MSRGLNETYASYWNWEVTLYSGDEILDQGTIREIAERRNVNKSTIYWYTMPSSDRRNAGRKDKTKGMSAIRTDGDVEGEL